jgi:hypothetical protein
MKGCVANSRSETVSRLLFFSEGNTTLVPRIVRHSERAHKSYLQHIPSIQDEPLQEKNIDLSDTTKHDAPTTQSLDRRHYPRDSVAGRGLHPQPLFRTDWKISGPHASDDRHTERFLRYA